MSPLEPLPTVVGGEIREVVLPLRRPYRSAGTAIRERRVLLVRLLAEEGEGWGECGPIPGYTPETAEECRRALEVELNRLVEGQPDEADPPPPPTAQFGVEAALLDLASRMVGVPLWRYLGGTRRVIPVGVVIGLGVPPADLATAAEWFLDAGYRRVKLKIAPGQARERVAAVRSVHGTADLAVDANGSFAPEDAADLASLEGFDLSFIEQPFPPDALEASARLAATLSTPICLDESIGSVAEAETAIDRGAAGIINVKPARLGGIGIATAVHEVGTRRGVPMWCGGMLESGIGKAAALAVASLAGMTLPAELPPSNRHLDADVVRPEWALGDDGVELPDAPGLGVEVDWEVIRLRSASTITVGERP